ncbi:MAG TPA: enolase C-terminal domain-like protein, partial [Vicinamibacterales bacterium]|nr:enolase C-terminal domain-like protein [Vicinamibacterales bacterium]
MTPAAPIEQVSAEAYRVPTDAPESDGTFEWESTTIVVCRVTAGGRTGLGYSYAGRAAATFFEDALADTVRGLDALDTNRAYVAMRVACRNNGRPGVTSAAVSAVDNALWDLKGRLLDAPVVSLLGSARDEVPVYGSGGFTSYTIERLQHQLFGWIADGITRVKMKIGRNPRDDVHRVAAARKAIGPDAQLFVDANGAYPRHLALGQAARFAEHNVTWFEEPVSSDDLDGLALMVDRAPAGMAIAAGEYGYVVYDFRRLLEHRAVDVLQADATRCAGITGFMRAAAVAKSFHLPLSSHCAPSIHAHPCCAAGAVHLEY